jgi:hypothetical protein
MTTASKVKVNQSDTLSCNGTGTIPAGFNSCPENKGAGVAAVVTSFDVTESEVNATFGLSGMMDEFTAKIPYSN